MAAASSRVLFLSASRRLIAAAFGAAAMFGAPAAQAEASPNGMVVTIPNGFANLNAEDMQVASTAGAVRWTRRWDGQEWKFNPQWESLSQSWANLTGSQTADTTGSTLSDGGTVALSGSSGGGSGCWVWVDEDWKPSVGTAVIGGIPEAAPLVPARSTPFNRVMGEARADYPALQRVSVDYASLCVGTAVSGGSTLREAEGIRRINELYLGDAGRYAFNNRAILEKRSIQQLAAGSADALYVSLGAGRIALAPESNAKGFRWIDKAGDWIDYNTQGQVVAWGDRNGNTVWLVRDTGGVVRGVVDANGRVVFSLHYTGELLTEVRDYPIAGLAEDLPARTVKYRYDDKNRLVEVTDVRGNLIKYGYDAQNRIVRITDQEGRVEQFAYSGSMVKSSTAPDGAVTDYLFEYDDTNKQFISKITGPETAAGRRVDDYTHNRVGKLVRRIVNGRADEEIRYDTGARAEVVTNARGFTTRTTRNEFDQIVEITYPDGAGIKRSYSALHLRLTEETDELGIKTRYEHDAKGNLLRKTEAVGTPEERISEYGRNSEGLITSLTRSGKTESNGTVTPEATWRFDYDAQGHISKATDPEGHVRRYTYDRAGNLVVYVDPLGHATRYQADADGNLIKVTDPLGQVWTYNYDKTGNQTSATSARGKTTQLAYDALNRNTRITSPLGGVYQLQYNSQGLPVSEIDEDGYSSEVQYDNFQRLVKQIDGKGNATEHGYRLADGSDTGAIGSLLLPTQTRYPTFTEQQRFDERERPTTRTILNPTVLGVEGLVTNTKYDRRGRVVETTNADGKTSYFAYDPLGRTAKFTNSLGKSIGLVWDARSNLIQLTDYNGNVTRFEYDRANRLVKEVLPLGQTTTYTYDAKGNQDTVTDPAGTKIRYFYDAIDQPERVEVSATGETSPSLTYTFTHDEDGNLTGWSDNTRGASYTYDAAGRLLTESLNFGNAVSLGYTYAYTAAGRVQSLTYPDGTAVRYAYESHGPLSSVEIPGEGTISVNAWNWVAPAKVTFPGGTTSEFSHDGLLKLAGLKVKNPGQQTVFEIANKYGNLEELKEKSVTDTVGASSATINTRYGYDGDQRLIQTTRDSGGLFGVTAETFGVDAAGNRVTHSAVSGTWTYDANNRLTQRGDTTYHYDAAGNLIERRAGTSGSANTVTRFKYDPLNRLVEVQDGAGNPVAKYGYDPFDNRIVKDLYRDASGNALATPRRTLYLYADEGLIAEADGEGTITVQYGWRPDGEWATAPLFVKAAISKDGAAASGYAYFHNDHVGTPLRATDKSGSVVWRAEYNSFGQAAPAVDNAFEQNLRLAGQYFDAETGLHYNTRRYYDPETGRYTTADPIGIAGGWNLYEYANSDPINQLDPTGEWVWVAIRVAMYAYDVYTTYTEITEQGACFDWTRLIPIPVKIPKIKWLNKRFKQCSNPCECMMGGGGRNSFPADTLVHAQDEHGHPTLKPIASLKVGDKVLAKSEWKAESESLGYEPITDVFTTPDQRRTLVHLTLADGESITATDGHPFKTADGWRDAILLKKGGKLLLRADGESDPERTVEIVDVRYSSETLTTYNLEVANAHTFFVGEDGVLVHNGRFPRRVHKPGRQENHNKYGRYQCEECGAECVLPQRHQKGERPPDNEAHGDHKIPAALGGPDTLDNYQLLCRKCNLRFGAKPK